MWFVVWGLGFRVALRVLGGFVVIRVMGGSLSVWVWGLQGFVALVFRVRGVQGVGTRV